MKTGGWKGVDKVGRPIKIGIAKTNGGLGTRKLMEAWSWDVVFCVKGKQPGLGN